MVLSCPEIKMILDVVFDDAFLLPFEITEN
jgi:hypothetical protein